MGYSGLPVLDVGDLVTSGYINTVKANLDYLLNPSVGQMASAIAASTNSTTFVDIDATNLSHTITTYGGPVLMMFNTQSYAGNATHTAMFTFTVNGSNIGGASGLLSHNGAATVPQAVSLTYLATGVAAGSNTFRVQYRSPTNNNISAYNMTTFTVVEI